MTGDGQLDQDTMHRRVIVGLCDLLEELRLSARLGDIDKRADYVGLGGIGVSHGFRCGFGTGRAIYLFGGLQLHAHIGAWVTLAQC